MCPKNSQCQHSQNLPSFLSAVPLAAAVLVLRDIFSAVQLPLSVTLLTASECILSVHCVSLHWPPAPAHDELRPAADLDRPTMSTSNLAAAALLIDADCLAVAAAGDEALHGGSFDSLPLVTGGWCLVCAARHGEARGRSDLLDDVVDVNDVVHAVVDVALDAAVDVALAVVVVVAFVLAEPCMLSVVVMVTVAGAVVLDT